MMIVYGDHPRATTIHALHAEAVAHVAHARGAPPGLERHTALVAGLIAHAEAVRALADERFALYNKDRAHPDIEAQMADTVRLARAVAISWRSHFRRTPVPAIGPPPPDAPVTTKPAEGFAFYALYPEAVYEAAARVARMQDDAPETAVIGLRSIGTALAAMAAAALHPRMPPITLRPTGHPFARTIIAAPKRIGGATRALIVDEGPGLSGSSLAAAARWATGQGVARVALLTTHPNPPGGEASPETRAIWDACARVSADFDATVLPRLLGWVSALLGESIIGWRDISAGAWALSLSAAPPNDPPRERRKYLATTPTARYLVKFAGVSDIGVAKLACARALAAGGLVPEPIGLAHGFLVERWIDAGPPSPPTHDEVTRYLAARTRLVPPNPGAPLAALIAMARANIAEALGLDAAATFAARTAGADALPSRAVATDNRLHAWEWLRDPAGNLFKADALDHCEAHDLIGCQDIAWDIAGAVIELGFDPALLTVALGANPALVRLHGLLYPAFQLGLWTMAGHPRVIVYARHLAIVLNAEPQRAVADR